MAVLFLEILWQRKAVMGKLRREGSEGQRWGERVVRKGLWKEKSMRGKGREKVRANCEGRSSEGEIVREKPSEGKTWEEKLVRGRVRRVSSEGDICEGTRLWRWNCAKRRLCLRHLSLDLKESSLFQSLGVWNGWDCPRRRKQREQRDGEREEHGEVVSSRLSHVGQGWGASR